MQYSKNYNMNLPELADQFNLKHQNENTEKIDTQMKANADAISAEERRATQKENAINSALTSEKATTKAHRENKNNPHGVTTTQIGAVPKERKINNHPLSSDVTVTKGDVGLGNVSNKTDNQLKQMVFDMMCPVNETVIPQYPGEPDPNKKYNKNGITSTWQDITATYNGRFFKISTSNVGTKTAESLPNIKGEFTCRGFGRDTDVAKSGCFEQSNPVAGFGSNDVRDWSNHNLKFNANDSSSVYRDSAKVQPDNVSIKLWKRTK